MTLDKHGGFEKKTIDAIFDLQTILFPESMEMVKTYENNIKGIEKLLLTYVKDTESRFVDEKAIQKLVLTYEMVLIKAGCGSGKSTVLVQLLKDIRHVSFHNVHPQSRL